MKFAKFSNALFANYKKIQVYVSFLATQAIFRI